MDRQEVIAKIHALELPSSEYVVVGGASMTIRGLRDTTDTDLVVTPELFDHLESLGWQKKPRPNGQPGLRHGVVEVYLEVSTPSCAPDICSLIARADIREGIPLVEVDTLLAWKRSYGRDKDARDVELLQLLKGGDSGAHTVA